MPSSCLVSFRRLVLPIVLIGLWAAVGRPAVAEEREAAGKPLRIHLISGSSEYRSEASLRECKRFLEENYHIECTASWGRDGATELDGLDALPSAELLVVFARRMKLPEEQMRLIRAHWEAGKPVIGVRTAGHAFQPDDNEVFDRQVLGGRYEGHYGNEPVDVMNVDDAAGHPVLVGVRPMTSRKLYKAGDLAPRAVVLQVGDNGQARHPVTFAHEHRGGRTFFTSLGVPEDFEDDNFRRLLLNAIAWTTRRDALPERPHSDAATGTLTGVVVLAGDDPIPEPAVLVRAGAPGIRGAPVLTADVYDRSLLVDPQTRGIANVAVYLRRAPEGAALTPPPESPVTFRSRRLQYEPRMLLVRTGRPILVRNLDARDINLHTHMLANDDWNVLLRRNGQRALHVAHPERLPMPVTDDIHDWMKANWLVLDHPFGAVTDEHGGFAFRGLPPGEHDFTFWHERTYYLERTMPVTIEAGRTTRVRLDVPVGRIK